MQLKTYIIVPILFLAFCTQLKAQSSLPLSFDAINEYHRRNQLLGQFDSTVSFLKLPLYSESFSKPLFGLNEETSPTGFQKNKWMNVKLLPVLSKSVYNQKQPYGWNNGSILPASGYQQMISAGFSAKVGPLKIQLYPEYLYAQNKEYDGFPLEAYDLIWYNYYRSQLNYIDTPERFGEKSINEVLWGQSSIKLEFGPVAFGLSNENIQWGPGKRNSLVMSNNARGFKHLTFNSSRPVKTPIGSFEWQLIGAKLENSGYTPPRPFFTYNGRFVRNPKNPDWRYMSGLMLGYQPKWIPGLSLGLTRVVQQYSETAKQNNDYLAALGSVFRKNDKIDDIVRDQLASIFLRYFWTSTKSEFYFEFARNDASWNFRDFFLEPGHAAGFMFGFNKLFPYKRKSDEFIEANLEWTILQQSANRIIRNASTFYIHSRVRQGYTNYGEVMGAGIGPSGNSQTLNVNWVQGINKIGLQLERYVHNNDLYIDLFTITQDPRRHWIDISAFAKATWQFDDLIIDGKLGVIKSLNYQYQILDQLRTPQFFIPGKDVINISAGLDLIYIF